MIERQFAPLPWRQFAQIEIAEMAAVQRDDFAALAGKHAAHLMVAAFGEDEIGCS